MKPSRGRPKVMERSFKTHPKAVRLCHVFVSVHVYVLVIVGVCCMYLWLRFVRANKRDIVGLRSVRCGSRTWFKFSRYGVRLNVQFPRYAFVPHVYKARNLCCVCCRRTKYRTAVLIGIQVLVCMNDKKLVCHNRWNLS